MNMALCNEAREAVKTLGSLEGLAIIWGWKKYLGHEMPHGFIAPTPFYLFFCISCRKFAKDYPHGYDSATGKFFLLCCFCKEKVLFKKRPKEIDFDITPNTT